MTQEVQAPQVRLGDLDLTAILVQLGPQVDRGRPARQEILEPLELLVAQEPPVHKALRAKLDRRVNPESGKLAPQEKLDHPAPLEQQEQLDHWDRPVQLVQPAGLVPQAGLAPLDQLGKLEPLEQPDDQVLKDNREIVEIKDPLGPQVLQG